MSSTGTPIRVATTLDDLPPHASKCFSAVLEALESIWDPDRRLIVNPDTDAGHPRATTRYLMGLLVRDEAGDRKRAVTGIESILDDQYTTNPEAPHYGCWPKTTTETRSSENSSELEDFDPNWREFVGTNLTVLHDAFADIVPERLRDRIAAANRAATEGTLARDVPAGYTNIALMRAYLIYWTACRFDRADYRRRAEEFADAIEDLYAPQETFCEFNSPTYTGVSLNALSQWVTGTGPDTEFHRLGRSFEDGLWRQISEFYHAELERLGGPYDRGKSMDTRRSLSDYYIWLATPDDGRIPYPESHHTNVPGNFGAVIPAILCRGWARVPDGVVRHLRSFQGERHIERQIVCDSSRRVATAWQETSIAIGGLRSQGSMYRNPHDALHAGTLHWRIDESTVGWCRVRKTVDTRPDVRADPRRLCVHRRDHHPIRFELYAPGLKPDAIEFDEWVLPELTIGVDSNAAEVSIEQPETDRRLVEFAAQADEELSIELTLTSAK